MPTDLHHLNRFIDAQENGQPETYATALAEIRAGRKRTHWIWYIFPQLRDLGRSEMARHYGIGSLDEARAYLAHPLLGPRLRECVAALQSLTRATVEPCFGAVDTLKLRSCLTLFAAAASDNALFAETLARLFDDPDAQTLALLRQST